MASRTERRTAVDMLSLTFGFVLREAPLLSARALRTWRVVQTAVWLVGVAILAALLFAPEIGIHAFWNVLIPVAPALVAFAPGLWRNICPLASTALFPKHVGLSAGRKISLPWQGRFHLIAVVALLVIVPTRHVVLDTSGPATALTIGLLAIVAVLVSFRAGWKSGWCSGLCPVHPVEKLYGSKPIVRLPNAHCKQCFQCVSPCPDSTPDVFSTGRILPDAGRLARFLLVGGFAGFIWGWFQVPDYTGTEGWNHLGQAFGWPFAGFAATLVLYCILRRSLPDRHEKLLVRCFAAAAIGCYYWYRLPMLFGFGPHPGDGMLLDLTATLTEWFPHACRAATTALFAWWLVASPGERRSWAVRPAFAESAGN